VLPVACTARHRRFQPAVRADYRRAGRGTDSNNVEAARDRLIVQAGPFPSNTETDSTQCQGQVVCFVTPTGWAASRACPDASQQDGSPNLLLLFVVQVAAT
jgi:hypothetical protein